MKNKKAMRGWIWILIILILLAIGVGVYLYFSVLDPGAFIPNRS